MLTNLQLYMKFEDEQNPEWREWDKTYGGHEKIHEYFRNNNMTSFIPIKYTYDKKTSIIRRRSYSKSPTLKEAKEGREF